MWKTIQLGRSSDSDAKTEAPCQGRCGRPRVTAGVAGPASRQVWQASRHGRCGRPRVTAGLAGSGVTAGVAGPASRQVWHDKDMSRLNGRCQATVKSSSERNILQQDVKQQTTTVNFNLEHFLDSRGHILKVTALHVSLLKLTWAFLKVIFCCLCRRYDRWRPC